MTSTAKSAAVNDKEHDDATVNRHLHNPLLKQSSKDAILTATNMKAPAVPNIPPLVQSTALGGVALIMGQYCSRRDVVRAACRLVNNLTGYTNVVGALEKINILDRMLECVFLHKDTKDILESTTSVIKIMYRRGVPVIQAQSASCIHGLLHLFKQKAQQDEEMVLACLEIFASLLEAADKLTCDKRRELDDSRALEGKLWEHHALAISVSLLEGMLESEKDGNNNGTSIDTNSNSSLVKSISSALRGWSKITSKIVTGVILLIESTHQNSKLSSDAALTKDCVQALMSLQRVIPSKNVDLHKRVDKILPLMDTSYGQHQLQQMQQRRQLQQDRIQAGKKPPRLSYSSAESGLEPLGSNTSLSTGNSSSKSNNNSNNATSSTMPIREDGSHANSFSAPLENIAADTLDEGIGSLHDTKATPLTNPSSSAVSQKNESINENGNRMDSNGLQENTSASERNSLKSNVSSCPPFSESVLPNGVKIIIPQHPSKSGNRNTISSGSQYNNDQLLLDCWPNYLERLLPSSGMNGNIAALNRDDSNNFTRMHLAYESLSAAGKGLVSKCPAPIPYSMPAEVSTFMSIF